MVDKARARGAFVVGSLGLSGAVIVPWHGVAILLFGLGFVCTGALVLALAMDR